MTFAEIAVHTPWLWLIGGLALCAAEILAPGVFLLWIGLAALAVGLFELLLPLAFAPSLLLFAILAIAFSFVGRRLYGGGQQVGGQQLNQRAARLTGCEFVLAEAIVAGSGRVRVQDTSWRVVGPDAALGTRVRVLGVVDGVVLKVEPV